VDKLCGSQHSLILKEKLAASKWCSALQAGAMFSPANVGKGVEKLWE
jgi:hypothetical protein